MSEKNLKILSIGDHLELGGAAQLLIRTQKILRDNGHEVVSFTSENMIDQIQEPEMHSFEWAWNSKRASLIILHSTLNLLGWLFPKSIKEIVNSLRHFYFPELTLQLKKILDAQERPFDFAHVNNLHGKLSTHLFRYLKNKNIPVIYQVNDYYFFCNTYYAYNKALNNPCDLCIKGNSYYAYKYKCSQYLGNTNSFIEAWRRFFLNLVNNWKFIDLYLVTSHVTGKILQKWGATEDKIHYIKNPIIDSEFNIKSTLGDRIIFYGSDLKLKGTERFLEALEFVDPGISIGVYLLSMSSTYEASLREVCTRRGIELHIDNKARWNNGLKEIIAETARAVVVPSQWWSTSETTIYESLFLGKPIILSNIGGNTELIIDGEQGLLFDPHDARQLAEKINLLAQDDNLVREMSKKAKAHAEKEFVEKKFYADFMAAVQRLKII